VLDDFPDGTPQIMVWHQNYPAEPYSEQGINLIVNRYENNSVAINGLYTFRDWSNPAYLSFQTDLYDEAESRGVTFAEKIEPKGAAFTYLTDSSRPQYDVYMDAWETYVTNALNWVKAVDGNGDLINPDRKIQVSIGHEFNSSWYPWATTNNVTKAQQYAEMYQELHKIANDTAFSMGLASYPTINPEASVYMASTQSVPALSATASTTTEAVATVTPATASSVSRQAVLASQTVTSSAAPAAMGTVSLDPYIYIDPMLMTSSPLSGSEDLEIDVDSLIAQN
jgi:hypothetical protein